VRVAEDETLLREFLENARRYATLEAGEEARLLVLARQGDKGASKRLLEGWLLIVAESSIARAPPWMRPLDAIQEGLLVMSRLIEDPAVSDPQRRLPLALQRFFDGLDRR
jgi:hypothetical protein